MSKIDVNNEIVSMRQIVRQARLHVVRKLIKQIKIFGEKKGGKQPEKYQRKADKLGQELLVTKKLKEDDISRYSITNKRSSTDVLSDPESDAELRVLARLSSSKVLSDRVAKFKQKFPNFEEHLGPGKRKLIKLKRKAGKEAKKEAKATMRISEQEETEKPNSNDDTNEDDNDSIKSKEDIEENLSQTEKNDEPSESSIKSEDLKRKGEIRPTKNKRIKTTDENTSNKMKEKRIIASKIPEEKTDDKLFGISEANGEAAVKSFASFLEEKEGKNLAPQDFNRKGITSETPIELEKEVDSFFMTEDGDGEYLSVVVPKLNISENDEIEKEDEMNLPNSARSRNNRFFDKVDNKYEKPKRNNHSNNYNKDKSDFVRGEDKFKVRNDSKNINSRINTRSNFKSYEKSSIGNESMHPSWAAKKKQQEILKLGFQGKKIVFDDA